MDADRCYCRECRDLDARTPERLQGIPGAYQARLFGAPVPTPAEIVVDIEPIEDLRPGPDQMDDMF